MRKKIQDLIKGKYEYTKPKLLVEEKVRFEVYENESYQGSFRIASERGERIRGVITSTHPYIECIVDQFDDTSVEVSFAYHAVGVKAGTKDKGSFVILADCGEYEVPFEAVITRFYQESSIGKVKTVNDLCNLAKLNWEEALRIFGSKYFVDILDEKSRLLYQGLCYRSVTGHEMEEFLVGIGKKSRIQFSVENPVRNLGRIRENVQDSIRVFKSGWGYLDIQISTDAEFILLKDSHMQASHFTGRDTQIPYVIAADRLHAGKNYGSIILKTPFQKHVIEICVQKSSAKRPDAGESAKKYSQRAHAVLTQKYLEYKLDRLSETDWLRESLEIFDKMIERNPSERWNFLMKCQFLLLQGKKEDAEWILEDAAYGCKDKKSPEWCVIRFLEQQLDGGETRRSNIQAEIRQAQQRNRDNLYLFLLLLHTDETLLQDPAYRYAVIKEYLMAGCCSPVVYDAAYEILKEHPEYAKEMDEIDIRICYWIGKQKLLWSELISVILEAAGKVRTFHNRFYWLLGRCYKQSKDEVCARVICTYLIVNNRYGEEYLHWFARGLENKMRIGGICEAYIQSWRRTDGDIPSIVLHYFAKHTVLPAVYKCRLYAYVVRNRERLEPLMESYRMLILPFLEEELKKNHMNDELAEICRYVKTLLSPEAWKEIHQNCTNIEKVIASNPVFTNVVVCQKGMPGCQKAVLSQNVSYVHLFSEQYQVLFEDGYGYRYVLKDGYRVNKMFPNEWKPLRTDGGQIEEITKVMEADAVVSELEEMAGTIESLDNRIRTMEAAGEETGAYQEALLLRMLFTGRFPVHHVDYFKTICKRNDTTQLRDAYVSWFSWRYLCYQEDVPEEVFEYLEYSVSGLRTLNRCCELALFQHLCEHGIKQGLTSWFLKIFEGLMEQGSVLPCFEKLPMDWKRAYFLHDCSYVSYAGAEGKKLICRLEITAGGKQFVSQYLVPEVIPGYYVLALRMFADEQVEYRFVEKTEDGEQTLASGTTRLPQGGAESRDGSRYGMLNAALQENQMQFDKLQKYAELTDMTEHLFQPL